MYTLMYSHHILTLRAWVLVPGIGWPRFRKLSGKASAKRNDVRAGVVEAVSRGKK